jgi:hypothetical protein
MVYIQKANGLRFNDKSKPSFHDDFPSKGHEHAPDHRYRSNLGGYAWNARQCPEYMRPREIHPHMRETTTSALMP